MSKPFLGERLRQAIQYLCRKSEQRAKAESTIQSNYQSHKANIETKFAEHEQRVQELLSTSQDDAIRNFQEKKQEIEKQFTTAHAKATHEWTEARSNAEEEYTRAVEKRDAEHKENLWTIETIFEADTKTAKDELTAQQRLVGKTVQDFDAIHRDIRKLLTRWKMLDFFEQLDVIAPEDVTHSDSIGALQQRVTIHETLLQQYRRLIAPRLLHGFRLVYLCFAGWLLMLLPALWMSEWQYWVIATAFAAVSIGFAVRFLLGLVLKSRISQIGTLVKENQSEAQILQQRCLAEATENCKATLAAAKRKHENAITQARTDHDKKLTQLKQKRDEKLESLRQHYEPLLERLGANRDRELRRAEETYQQAIAAATERFDTDMENAVEKKKNKLSRNQLTYETNWRTLLQDWKETGERFLKATSEVDHECVSLFPDWSSYFDASIPGKIPHGIRIGQLDVNLEQIPHGVPTSEELRNLAPGSQTLPALLDFPCKQSLLIKASGMGRARGIELLQAVMLRCLLSLPPGKVRFTIIDPVGLGENFAAFAHLADYDDKLVTSRIWTEKAHIEQRLADLTQNIESIIQNYLRNQFATLDEYNAQAGEVAEPYRVLVIASFPVNFTDEACKRLINIAQSGLRCGIQTFILLDTDLPMPEKFRLDDLENHSAILTWENGKFAWQDEDFGKFPLKLDAPPEAELCTKLLHLAGDRAKNASKVEVPFQHIAPPAELWWKGDTRDGIRVALGKAGATRKQFLDLGKGTAQHVLVAGKTGSGKSTLLHALIVQLALSYSPDEIELYLVDFKKGVEFKTYATHHLPHARVVAIESEREFGLSVLKRLDAELRQRGDTFRKLGVHDVNSCRAALAEPMPRVLLIVDEFQEFFVEDDRVAQEAALLMDRLVRQGRAFGIHVLLGSQTLGGAYSLARSTIDQMAVRIALQCSEADGHLILSKDNYGARLLSRPGEAIYNDANGLVEGNYLFQTVWMPEKIRENCLRQIQNLSQSQTPDIAHPRQLIVFEGNSPALLPKNPLLHQLLEAETWQENGITWSAWLGESIAIKDPTVAVFSRQSGSNLLLVGQHVEGALSAMTSAVISLAAALPPRESEMDESIYPDAQQEFPLKPEAQTKENGSQSTFASASSLGGNNSVADFYLICDEADHQKTFEEFSVLADVLPQRVKVGGWEEAGPAVAEIAEEVEQRIGGRRGEETLSGTSGKKTAGALRPIFLFIYGLQQFRHLRRQEDDFGFSRSSDDKPPHPSKQLANILRDGPVVGVFTILWCDTFNNVQRFLDRQLLKEFDMRILFQMNANDSSNLIDSPVASRLGLHRALFCREDQGKLEKFRPYALPPQDWLAWVKERLRRAAIETEAIGPE